MKQYINIFIFSFLISLQANAHFGHSHQSRPFDSSNMTSSIISAVGLIWNGAEIVNHLLELWKQEIGPDTVYHVLELAGHSGNLANYVADTGPVISTLLFGYNLYALTAQSRSIARNIKEPGLIPLLQVLLSSGDFVGHLGNALYFPYSIWKNWDTTKE